MKEIQTLVRLQNIETEIQRINKQMDALPAKIDEINDEVSIIEDNFSRLEPEISLKKERHTSLEHEIGELTVLFTRNKERLRKIENNREFQALLKENEQISKSISELEEEGIALLEEVTKKEEELTDLNDELKIKKKELKEKKEASDKKIAELKPDIEDLEQRKNELIDGMPKDLIRNFNFLIKKLDKLAVVSVSDGVCDACHMRLPPQKFNELISDSKIMSCPSCHRLIYWREHEDYSNVKEEL